MKHATYSKKFQTEKVAEMTVTDEIRKTLTDPKPLYVLAGAGDLAVERLRDVPGLATGAAQTVSDRVAKLAAEAPERLAKAQADLTTELGKVQSRLADVPAALDPKNGKETRAALRDAAVKATDPQVLRGRAQQLALAQIGRMLDAAGRAVETYDGLAERGRAAVTRFRGAPDQPSNVTVIVEQVIAEDEELRIQEQAEFDAAVAAEAAFEEELEVEFRLEAEAEAERAAEDAALRSGVGYEDDPPIGFFDEAAFEAAAFNKVREPQQRGGQGTETAEAESSAEAADAADLIAAAAAMEAEGADPLESVDEPETAPTAKASRTAAGPASSRKKAAASSSASPAAKTAGSSSRSGAKAAEAKPSGARKAADPGRRGGSADKASGK